MNPDFIFLHHIFHMFMCLVLRAINLVVFYLFVIAIITFAIIITITAATIAANFLINRVLFKRIIAISIITIFYFKFLRHFNLFFNLALMPKINTHIIIFLILIKFSLIQQDLHFFKNRLLHHCFISVIIIIYFNVEEVLMI